MVPLPPPAAAGPMSRESRVSFSPEQELTNSVKTTQREIAMSPPRSNVPSRESFVFSTRAPRVSNRNAESDQYDPRSLFAATRRLLLFAHASCDPNEHAQSVGAHA